MGIWDGRVPITNGKNKYDSAIAYSGNLRWGNLWNAHRR